MKDNRIKDLIELRRGKKIKINITLDANLVFKLRSIQKKYGLKLAPIINEVLLEWLEDEGSKVLMEEIKSLKIK